MRASKSSRQKKLELPDFGALKKFYTSDNVVAEHTSPPLSEDVKVTLKVSQNLHASMGPYLLGIYGAKATTRCLECRVQGGERIPDGGEARS